MTEPVVTFRDLTLGYGRRPAVHHLSGRIGRGDLLALVGPNGAGKSTLLKGIVGEAEVLGGTVELGGIGRSEIAYLPQRAEIDTAFPIGIGDFVATGLWRRVGAWRAIGRAGRAAVAAAVAAVGLQGFERRPIGTLSGGQLQRALFARAVVQDAPLLLLDEPFAAVDEGTVTDLLGIVAGWHREGRTVMAALHDLSQVRSTFPDTLLLAREPVAWGPTASVLTPDNIARSRGRREAWDDGSEACLRADPSQAAA